MSNNNNNSDKIYVIVGVVCFLCFMSSGAALLIRNITKSDAIKKSSSPSPSPPPYPSPSPSSAQPVSSSAQPVSSSAQPVSSSAQPPPSYTIKEKTRFKPSKMTNGYVNISDGSVSRTSLNAKIRDTTIDACKSKCDELDKCTSFQWVPGDNYCNMVSDKPFYEGSLLRTMIESNDRYDIYIKP